MHHRPAVGIAIAGATLAVVIAREAAAQDRDLSADRPDATESPITVPRARLQLEMSFVDLSWDKAGSESGTRTIALAPMVVKVGLDDHLDLQLGLDPFTSERSRDRSGARGVTRAEGFGDTVLRLKRNLWGNDGGESAAAVMPFIKIPTADDSLGNDRVEGGLILPLAFELNERWSVGLMGQWDLVYDEVAEAYRSDLVHTLVVGTSLTDRLGAFVEYAGAVRVDGGEDYRGSVNFGVTCRVSDDVQLDLGTRIGVTPAAEDLGIFAGVTVRY
jgi:hypothetical protein